MKNKINIYDLNNPAYIEKDIEDVISRIGHLYEIQFCKDQIKFVSKINFSKKAHWVSNETSKIFNETIPIIKSIIKDIYSILEGIFVAKYGKFNKPKTEIKYELLRTLREFNNKLKHHNNKNVVFNLSSMVNINSYTLDCLIQYKYENESKINAINLVEFFQLFFVIMEDEEIIKLDRK
ncbi:hypothetical protein Q4595_16300 [Wenyingzhuangia sp. 1_MG-2023]|nr:hypothetical protein [Wenyingzhuangia sp. 1_MG-2023]